MRKMILATACAAILALPACQMSTEDQMVLGGVVGLGAGLLTADMLDANPQWTVLAALGGAAAGAMVARNNATQECAYSRGDGTYEVRRCPR